MYYSATIETYFVFLLIGADLLVHTPSGLILLLIAVTVETVKS